MLSVVNAGTATSATAKAVTMADISRLTQALARGATWAALNESVITRISTQFATKFGARLTKQGLGKAVPAIGILIGGTMNWATMEGIVDAAELAYRRRFLIEKYPRLGDESAAEGSSDEEEGGDGPEDEAISVLDELEAAGGPHIA